MVSFFSVCPSSPPRAPALPAGPLSLRSGGLWVTGSSMRPRLVVASSLNAPETRKRKGGSRQPCVCVCVCMHLHVCVSCTCSPCACVVSVLRTFACVCVHGVCTSGVERVHVCVCSRACMRRVWCDVCVRCVMHTGVVCVVRVHAPLSTRDHSEGLGGHAGSGSGSLCPSEGFLG